MATDQSKLPWPLGPLQQDPEEDEPDGQEIPSEPEIPDETQGGQGGWINTVPTVFAAGRWG
jgi:hypothetical protein